MVGCQIPSRPKEFIGIRSRSREKDRMKSMGRGTPPNHPKSTGPESIGTERTDFGIVPRRAVGSPAATTLENNEKIRLPERAENELCREVGGAKRTGIQHSLDHKLLVLHKPSPELLLPARYAPADNGILTDAVVPSPTQEVKSMEPPRLSTIPWTTARPRPVPSPTGLVVKNGSDKRCKVWLSIPPPQSRTTSTAQPFSLANRTKTGASWREASAAFFTRLVTS